jgi:hypothetical protein
LIKKWCHGHHPRGSSPAAEGRGLWEGCKRAMATDNAESSWHRLVDTRWVGTTCLQEAWSFYGKPSYYRDIHVWLPNVHWGSEAMPPCVVCKLAEDVSPHDFLKNHFGCRVCVLTTNYFIVTQCYTCSCCAHRASNTKLTIEAVAEATGLGVEDAIIKPKYTFMGYDPCSRVHLPHGYGDEYPASNTYKGALDLLIIDLMRPLFNKGVCPAALLDILLELHAKKYTCDYLKREQNLARDSRLGIIANKVKTMYLLFGN